MTASIFRHGRSGIVEMSAGRLLVSGGQFTSQWSPEHASAERTLCLGQFRSIETLRETSAVLSASKQRQFQDSSMVELASPRANQLKGTGSSNSSQLLPAGPRPEDCASYQHSSRGHPTA